MIVRALRSFSAATEPMITMNPGEIRTIEDLDLVQSLIESGFVVEVEACPTCGSYVEKQ